MKFRRVFRGYSPQEVENRLNTLKKKNDDLLSAQRRRIDELTDENSLLNAELQNLKIKEQALASSMIEANEQSEQLRVRAEKYAETIFLRAKIFCEAWQNYAKVMVNSLDDSEIRQFNAIFSKLKTELRSYGESDKSAGETKFVVDCRHINPIEKIEALLAKNGEQSADDPSTVFRDDGEKDADKNRETVSDDGAPVIDLDELANPTESLDDICKFLGLKK